MDYEAVILKPVPQLWISPHQQTPNVEDLTRLEALFSAIGDPKDYEEYVYSQLKMGKAYSLADYIETRIGKWLQSWKRKRERVRLGIDDDLPTFKCEGCGSTTDLEKPTETVLIYWTRNGKIKPIVKRTLYGPYANNAWKTPTPNSLRNNLTNIEKERKIETCGTIYRMPCAP